MKSVNKVILLGNLGKDPELKHTPSGTAVATVTLATNDRYKDKNGDWQDKTEWHFLEAWERYAEILSEYGKKGNTIYIEGSLKTDSWEDKQTGEKRYATKIKVSDIVLLGGGKEREAVGVAAADSDPFFS